MTTLESLPIPPGAAAVSRRWTWKYLAAGTAAAAGATALTAEPAEAAGGLDRQVAHLLTRRGRTHRVLTRLVDRRLQAFQMRLLSTVLPAAVAKDGPLGNALDQRIARLGVPDPIEALPNAVVLTQAAYDALPARDPDTLYVVVD